MSKRSWQTSISPLPPTISRETAIRQLHDHVSMLELNPLIVRHVTTHPHPNASPDEAEHATWYEITDLIHYLPGGVVKSEVSYKACFYDLPRGLQTHVWAPAGLDMKSKWLVCGNAPGEPREPHELGVDAPREGLYIKEEIEMKCNIFLAAFVKRNLKKSHQVVIDKIIEKAGTIENRKSRSVQRTSTSLYPAGQSTYANINRSRSLPLGPSRLTSTRAPQSGQQSREQESIVHYPPHCACRGTTHDPTCSFFHADDVRRGSVAGSAQQRRPFYAISLPSGSSNYSQSSSPTRSSHRKVAAHPEQCLCTGALHDGACPSYPGLRIRTGPSSQSSPVGSQWASSKASVSSPSSPPVQEYVLSATFWPQAHDDQLDVPAMIPSATEYGRGEFTVRPKPLSDRRKGPQTTLSYEDIAASIRRVTDGRDAHRALKTWAQP